MKERPILFSGDMVRALLEGRKTMTRRVCKLTLFDMELWIANRYSNNPNVKAACPYGQPGDQLWVRETWANLSKPEYPPEYIYRADPVEINEYEADGGKWRPSIFMTRKASRIDLETTAVRVERVHDISEEDAKAEGVCSGFECDDIAAFMDKRFDPERESTFRLGFKHLWNFINAKRGYGWEVNPWVWVIEFKRIKP